MGCPAMMIVRQLAFDDALEYRALMLQAYALAPDAFTSTPDERAAEPLSYWQGRIAGLNPPGVAFGAFLDGVLIGNVAIEYSNKTKTRHRGLIIGMYVSPLHRRLGAAKALLQTVMNSARERPGLKVVELDVTQGNIGAATMYEAAGFIAYGVQPMALFTGTEFKTKVHMQLILSNLNTP